MSDLFFDDTFRKATDFPPFDYQCRLACGPEASAQNRQSLKGGTTCESQLINIPTGLGKTAAVVLAWLWNRVLCPDLETRDQWPRRLIYCLPMRTLVEQTRDNVTKWLSNHLLFSDGESDHADKVGLHILMGGEDKTDWDLYPENDAILIGTQDMLVSRSLNRGYGMSRYRWPMHFALLNNDALWVMDETQLMGTSVETSAQLDGFRRSQEWSPFGATPTWWMSATLHKGRLSTVDHREPADGWRTVALFDSERGHGSVLQRYEATKAIARAQIALSSASKKDYAKQVAALIAQKHQPGGLTLVVVNRVARAQEIYAALSDKKLKLDSGKIVPSRVALVHSRFRQADRRQHTDLLMGTGDRIVIATQAVEAGVDVSARLLITELAPWSSMVQRFGRCNRAGEIEKAEIVWIDVQPKDDKDDLALPYSAEELKTARAELEKLADAGPKSLSGIVVPEPPLIRPVLRRRDLIDLFDTTPDLCGQDLDISCYIRDEADNDVQFFWRRLNDLSEESEGAQMSDAELCRVSIYDAEKFVKSEKVRALEWDPLDRRWKETKRVRPGGVYLIEAASGGYSEQQGWTKESKDKLDECLFGFPPREAYDKDRLSFARPWVELDRHTGEVVEEVNGISAKLRLDAAKSSALHTAARWHDVGKAHETFQMMLRGNEDSRKGTLWAKSGLEGGKCERRGFRHELASALAWLLHGPADTPDRDLIAYLIAAHHGKVRLSIRALPDEKGPDGDGERPFARGVWDGDELPVVNLPGVPAEKLQLDLSFMRMGEGVHGPSWLARMIAIRDQLGPFRLAYLETVLRAADMRASAAAAALSPRP